MLAKLRGTIAATAITAGVVVFLFCFGAAHHAVLPLAVTFIPAAVLACVGHLLTTNRRMPEPRRIIPLYVITLGWQFVHFTEEFTTDFQGRWLPQIFHRPPLSDNLMVTFNMTAYVVFLIAGVLGFLYRRPVPTLAAWAFIMGGAVQNAVEHPIWAIIAGHYFPGLYTSLAFWVLGPALIARLWRDTRTPANARRGSAASDRMLRAR